MEELSYRNIIVERLQERNKNQTQINNYVTAYKNLVEEYKNLSLRLARQSLQGHWNSLAQNNPSNNTIDFSKELMEEKNKVKMYEKEIDKLKNENNKLTNIIIKNENEINTLKIELKEEKESRTMIHDDYLELNLRANVLSEKLAESKKDYYEVLDRYNKLKSKEIEWYNIEVERENERQKEKKILQQDFNVKVSMQQKVDPIYEFIAQDDNYKLPALGSLSSYDILMNKCVDKQKISEFDDVLDICWSRDGDFLFTGCSDTIVKRFEFHNERLVKTNTYRKSKKSINRLDLCEDKGLILGASNDCCTYIWNISNETVRYIFTGHTEPVLSAKFIDINKKIASGGKDRIIKVWDVSRQQIIRNFLPATTIVDILDVKDMTSCFLSGHVRKELHLWDDRSSTSDSQSHIVFEDKITSLHEVPGTMQVLCSIADETLSLIDIRNMMELHSYSAEQFHISSEHSKCTVSPNGQYIATGSSNGLVFIWNVQSTKLEKILPTKEAHEGPVVSIAWHPFGNYLATGDKKQTICIWGSGI